MLHSYFKTSQPQVLIRYEEGLHLLLIAFESVNRILQFRKNAYSYWQVSTQQQVLSTASVKYFKGTSTKKDECKHLFCILRNSAHAQYKHIPIKDLYKNCKVM